MRKKVKDFLKTFCMVLVVVICASMSIGYMDKKTAEELEPWWEAEYYIKGSADYLYNDIKYGLANGISTEKSICESYMITGLFSPSVNEQLLRDGFCRQYIPQLKAAGVISQDFTIEDTPTETPVETPPTDNSSSQNTSNSETSSNGNSANNNSNKEVIVDGDINGSYVVTKPETSGFSEPNNSNKEVTLVLGSEVEVTGLTNNGYYRTSYEDKEIYVYEKNLTEKQTYEDAWEETSKTEPTCEEQGIVTYTNTLTDETKEEILDALGHTFTQTSKTNPSCVENGKSVMVCDVCRKEEVEEIEATGHNASNWKVVSKATLLKDGKRERVCETCGEVIETETLRRLIPISVLIIVPIVVLIAAGMVTFIIIKKKRK